MTLIEKLKKFLAESDEDVEKVLTSEQVERIEKLDSKIQKEMEENLDVVLLYEDVPDDLESVHKFAFKQIIDQLETDEVGKAGAKLSKTTQAQIKEALGHIKDNPKAVAILETLLGIESKKTEKKKEGDEENLSAETIAQLERLEEFEKKEKEELSKEAEKEQAEKVVDLVNKALKDAGLEEIAQKTSIDDPEGDKDKKKETKKGAGDDEDRFPSIPIPVLGD
ncbi:MAG: hypothetical protein KAV87_06155 [Desulfobacteraceae bacterium]|nr:hypothetical protein [Desulfobacteraceae bacterium]